MQFYKPSPSAKPTILGIIWSQLGLLIAGAGAAYGNPVVIAVGVIVYFGGLIALLVGAGNFLSSHDAIAMHTWNTIRLAEQEEEDRAKQTNADHVTP